MILRWGCADGRRDLRLLSLRRLARGVRPGRLREPPSQAADPRLGGHDDTRRACLCPGTPAPFGRTEGRAGRRPCEKHDPCPQNPCTRRRWRSNRCGRPPHGVIVAGARRRLSPMAWLTVTEAATRYRVSARTLRNLAAGETVKARRVGPLWQLDQRSLEAYLAKEQTRGRPRRTP